jgi:thiamine biosynthesis lipoprotein
MTSPAPPKGSSRILPGRARILLPGLLVALLLASIHRLVCAPVPTIPAQFSGPTMGTTWSVTLAVEDLSVTARGGIQQSVEAELAGVDERMSTYRDDSELSRFNRAAADVPFPISTETVTVFQIARDISERSDGAFDVTVDPLVAAWGFGATDRIPAAPPAAELSVLMERVGFRFVEIDAKASTLRKTRNGVRCDLTAIAKGTRAPVIVVG